MKQYLVLCAIVCLAFSGCASNMLMGCKSCGELPCHIVRSQNAPRPLINRTACRPEGLKQDRIKKCSNACCDDESCCDDSYCDVGCGCCDEYCSSDNGCSDGYCNIGDRCRNGSCSSYDGRGCGPLCRARNCNPHAVGYPEQYNFNPSPPTGQVGYPYYTVRGPRDFLRNNPPTIGPY